MNQNIFISFSEHQLRISFKTNQKWIQYFYSSHLFSVICKHSKNRPNALKIGVEKCRRVLKSKLLNLEKYVLAYPVTENSIYEKRNFTTNFESSGFDYKRLFGFSFIMFLLVLIFIGVGSRKSNRTSRRKRKYTKLKKSE